MTAASTPGGDALARATQALRHEDEPGWPDLAERVSRRLRTVSRPGRPLTVGDTDAGVLRVDERVMVDTVRRALARVPACRPVGVRVEAEAQAVTGLHVQVSVDYGAHVVVVADAARGVASAALAEVLGRRCPVDVSVVDVEGGPGSTG